MSSAEIFNQDCKALNSFISNALPIIDLLWLHIIMIFFSI